MKKLVIIADSGGTKTDWLIYDESGRIKRISTESYHPRIINSEFILRNTLFWSQFNNLGQYQLHFYGSGCLKEENALKIEEALVSIGFHNPLVQSDMHAAAISLNVQDGWVAICGTGSVVFEMKNGAISTIRGGLGKELGDEGSGYYFGKLLAKSVLTGKLIVPDIPIHELSDEKKYSTFASKLSHLKHEKGIRELHIQNIQLFIDKHLTDISQIGFVGSYSFHHRILFSDTLELAGIQATKLIERPIELFV